LTQPLNLSKLLKTWILWDNNYLSALALNDLHF